MGRLTSIAFAGAMTAALWAGVVCAQERPATEAENVMIQHYRSVINTVIGELGAGWSERQPNHFDIPDEVTVYGATEGGFQFFGDVSRMYERQTAPGPDKSEQIQALMAKRQKAKTAAEKQAIMAQIQALAFAPVEEGGVSNLLITSQHNQPYFAMDSEEPQVVTAPAGVAMVYQAKASQVSSGSGGGGGAKSYVLEFGDPAAMVRSDPDQRTNYHFAHNDGSAHIENIEIHIEGPPEVVDALLKGYDWTKVDAALTQ